MLARTRQAKARTRTKAAKEKERASTKAAKAKAADAAKAACHGDPSRNAGKAMAAATHWGIKNRTIRVRTCMRIHHADLPHLRVGNITVIVGFMKNFIFIMGMMATAITLMALLFLFVIFAVLNRSSYRFDSALLYVLVPLALTLEFGFLS